MKKRKTNRRRRALATLGLLLAAGLWLWHGGRRPLPVAPPTGLTGRQRAIAERIVQGARAQVERGVLYDASYRVIAYPGGDVRADRGACTDVLIRALRSAGCDLQKLIHDDMRRHFDRYPRRYGLTAPDANIDHRRVPNQIAFLRRHGRELPSATTGAAAATWQPGDLVYWRLPNGTGHCGVLSDARNDQGLPLVIHNLQVARQEDCLTAWEIVAHFRYPLRP
jgi:uncharacterized protein YijF (DUF1287 family)